MLFHVILCYFMLFYFYYILFILFYVSFFIFFNHRLYSPTQLVKGFFTVSDLLRQAVDTGLFPYPPPPGT